MRLLFNEREDLLLRHGDINGRDIDPAGQDALHGHVAELQRRRDQLSLILVQRARFGHILDDVIEFIFGNGGFRLSREKLRGRIADDGKERGERPQNSHQEAKQRSRGQTDGLSILSCDAFGQHFREEKYGKGSQQRRQGDRGNAPDPGDVYSNDGRCGKMGNIRTDQDRCDSPVNVLRHVKRFLRTGISPVHPGSQPGAGDGCESGFRERKEHSAKK